MKYFSPLMPFILALVFLLWLPVFREITLVNCLLQLVLFALVVCLPTWRTGRMSWVDIGWPWGLVVIGIVTWLYGTGDSVRVALVSLAYIFAGARMGFGALKLWQIGHLAQELPRYEYQKQRWQRAGKSNQGLAMQVEALLQGFANASFLALPAFLISTNSSAQISPLEVMGIAIWCGAFVMESIADSQKLRFAKSMKKAGRKWQVCNVGLWRYSRHPNYFAEWMVWNGLIIAAIPSLIALIPVLTVWLAAILAIGLAVVSRIMYTTLVYYTGAVPSEYYSAIKRPDYASYQKTTNRFFPGPVQK